MVNWEAVAAFGGIAQGIGTLGAFYLTIHLLKETAATARIASQDQANRVAPHLVMTVDVQFSIFDSPRIAIRVQNYGLGPAVRVAIISPRDLIIRPVSGEAALTSQQEIALLQPNRIAGFAGRSPGLNPGDAFELHVHCEDLAGGRWAFKYCIDVPRSSQSINVSLDGIERPGLDPGRRRRPWPFSVRSRNGVVNRD